jgi:uncharacterized protein
MTKSIFVNLPVADLAKSTALYEALGLTLNPQWSDETAASMVWSENIYVMLLSHAKWKSFTTRPIAAAGSSEVALAITLDSKDEVNRMVEAAASAGGVADINPPEDHGFMYQRSFADLDGHIWEPFWMDPAAMPASA